MITAKIKMKRDHTEARNIFAEYQQKAAILVARREYARRVEKATAGAGMTPVEPLATMGHAGGPLVCDHCGKPMILEGGGFQGVYADVAWKKKPQVGWKSYISGGMVVEIQSNETLRIYHGYPGRSPQYCCNLADAALKKAEAAFVSPLTKEIRTKLFQFLEDEFPDMPMDERMKLLNDIFQVMYGFDPGLGVNHP